MTRPIERAWQDLLESQWPEGLCCQGHHDLFRLMYFTGAMAAVNAMTGWDPDVSAALVVTTDKVQAVVRELNAEYATAFAGDEKAEVRH